MNNPAYFTVKIENLPKNLNIEEVTTQIDDYFKERF